MSQDREFVAAVVRVLPEPPEDVKQGWIENPQGLEDALRKALCPSKWSVEADGTVIFRGVKVNRGRTVRQAIRATNRVEYLNDEVVDNAPRDTEEEVDIRFFPLGKFTSPVDAQKALEGRGLKPDPVAVAAANEADPSFADDHPNTTQWKDASGNHCYVAFDCWNGKREVVCDRHEFAWCDYWWVGGVVPRK